MGESCDPDGMNVIVIYKDEKPMCYFFKDGLIEEKVVSCAPAHTHCGVDVSYDSAPAHTTLHCGPHNSVHEPYTYVWIHCLATP